MDSIYDIFDEFNTNTITVADFGIITNGVLVTHVCLGKDNNVEIWAGNPDNDKYAEELVLSRAERRRVFEEILKNF